MSERRIGIVTATRAEYGILRSLIRAVMDDRDLELHLLVSGTHLSEGHGLTVDEIEEDGVAIRHRLPILVEGGDEAAAVRTAGKALEAAASVLVSDRPDVLVVLGDRSEILAFALAGLLCRIPIAHLHGGEITLGAVDESIRHAVTKLASYHFVAAEPYARNVIQLGEDPERVFTVGAPGLDTLAEPPAMSREQLCGDLGLDPERPTALVALHPVTTRDAEANRDLVDAVLNAVSQCDVQAVFTGANADAHGDLINTRLQQEAARFPGRYHYTASLGHRRYLAALRALDVLVGNSSSGLIEAPSCGLPVVNVGDRQAGRLVAENIIETGTGTEAVTGGLRRALDENFRSACREIVNPYAPAGIGGIGGRIKDILKTVPLGPEVLRKPFHRVETLDA